MDEEEFAPQPIIGAAQPGNATEDQDYPAGTLYLPDPESRTGWLCRWVTKQKPEQKRGMGFRGRNA